MYPGFTFVTLESMLYYLSGAVGTEAVRHGKIRYTKTSNIICGIPTVTIVLRADKVQSIYTKIHKTHH